MKSQAGRALIQWIPSGEKQVVDFDNMTASPFLDYEEAADAGDLDDWNLDLDLDPDDLVGADGLLRYRVIA